MERFSRVMRVRLQSGQGQGKECCLDPGGQQRFAGGSTWTPNTDIVEMEDEVLILMELAGVDKEAVQISCKDDLLRISGLRARNPIPQAKCFHRMEIEYGPFEKFFRVPRDLNFEGIKAEYKNGFLEVSLPKKRGDEPKQIVVVYEEG